MSAIMIHNIEIECHSKDMAILNGHEIPCRWDEVGCKADMAAIQSLRDSGDANLSDEEMADVAYCIETRMQDAFEDRESADE